MASEGTAAAYGMLGGMVVATCVGVLALLVLTIVARWKLFGKAGEAGWKSIVPIYSDYVQWRIGWRNTAMFWVYLGLVFVGYILMTMSGAYAEGAAAQTVNMPMMGIGAVAVLAGAVLAFVAIFKLFKSFGWGVGQFVLYIFFPHIMLLVLGFGSAEYVGAQG